MEKKSHVGKIVVVFIFLQNKIKKIYQYFYTFLQIGKSD